MKTLKRLALAAILILALAGCDSQYHNDAPSAGNDKTPADVIAFPNNFPNVATKCDHGNRIYVTHEGDNGARSISVVPKDPTCPQPTTIPSGR